MKQKIKISLVDDHPLLRRGVVSLIAKELSEFEVVMEASHGLEFLELLEKAKHLPDIALVDISMPVMDGYDTIKNVREKFPSITCVALSVESEFISVFRMINAGAKAYLLKECLPEKIKETLQKVSTEGSYYDSFVVDSLMEYNRQESKLDEIQARIKANISELTIKETEFVKCCCSELTYKEIAVKMGVSQRTVDGYREEVFDKLDIRSRTGVVLFAIRNRLYEV